MKKILVLFLAVLFVLPGCGKQTPAQQEAAAQITEFSVGYSRKIINPDEAIPLVGYGNEETRYLQELGHDITVTVLAISDGEGNDILIVNTDMCTTATAWGDPMQNLLYGATNIPLERIYISSNHSHSAPKISGGEAGAERITRYREKVYNLTIEAAQEALADRKTATMEIGSIETENLNFVKHYQYVDENGQVQYFGDNFGTAVYNETTQHTTPVDPTMHLMRFKRAGDKDVVVVNWRAHPHFTGGSKKYVLSSDYPGAFREAFERQTGVECIYLQGACGNVNSSTRLAEERRTTDVRTFGALLADYAIEGLENNMSQIQPGTIKTRYFEYYGEINHRFDDLVVQARTVASIWKQTNSWDECRPYMTPFGIRSPYHANAIVANASRTKEVDGLLRLNAVTIGEDFCFVTFPGELFDTISVEVEEGSPYKNTMLVGYSNGHIGYLPSAYAFEYTSYETDITRFAEGTGELVREQYISMLTQLKEG